MHDLVLTTVHNSDCCMMVLILIRVGAIWDIRCYFEIRCRQTETCVALNVATTHCIDDNIIQSDNRTIGSAVLLMYNRHFVADRRLLPLLVNNLQCTTGLASLADALQSNAYSQWPVTLLTHCTHSRSYQQNWLDVQYF